MIRIYDGADINYINRILGELEKDEDYCYEIDIRENRTNSKVESVEIRGRRVESINF